MTSDPFRYMATRTRFGIRQRGYAHAGDVTADELRARFAQFDNRCAYCGLDDIEMLGPDHELPLARGGLNIIENIVPACHPCNRRKGALSVDDFRMLRAPTERVKSSVLPTALPSSVLPSFLTERELANFFRTGLTAIRRRIEDGSLKAVNVGTEKRPKWRIEDTELARFIAARSSTPPEE